jgi:hypothetical protein
MEIRLGRASALHFLRDTQFANFLLRINERVSAIISDIAGLWNTCFLDINAAQ